MDFNKAEYEATWKDLVQATNDVMETTIWRLERLRTGLAEMCALLPPAAGIQILRLVNLLCAEAVESLRESNEGWIKSTGSIVRINGKHRARLAELMADLKASETLEDRLKRLAVESTPPRPPAPGDRSFRLRQVSQN